MQQKVWLMAIVARLASDMNELAPTATRARGYKVRRRNARDSVSLKATRWRRDEPLEMSSISCKSSAVGAGENRKGNAHV
jgi:hypothetical protein